MQRIQWMSELLVLVSVSWACSGTSIVEPATPRATRIPTQSLDTWADEFCRAARDRNEALNALVRGWFAQVDADPDGLDDLAVALINDEAFVFAVWGGDLRAMQPPDHLPALAYHQQLVDEADYLAGLGRELAAVLPSDHDAVGASVQTWTDELSEMPTVQLAGIMLLDQRTFERLQACEAWIPLPAHIMNPS